MIPGQLYFVKDDFYERFKDCGLLGNKESMNGIPHNRPCCYLFKFTDNDKIYWMIPISSKIQKYTTQYNKSMQKYGKCDNISFVYVLGEKRAILPQNLFPVTENYIDGVYIDKNTRTPISFPKNILSEINKKARKKIRYNQNGKKFGMTDIVTIYNELLKDLSDDAPW